MNNVIAEEIIAKIVDDLTDRRGLKQEWWQIDEDIQLEIQEVWYDIVVSKLKEYSLIGS